MQICFSFALGRVRAGLALGVPVLHEDRGVFKKVRRIHADRFGENLRLIKPALAPLLVRDGHRDKDRINKILEERPVGELVPQDVREDLPAFLRQDAVASVFDLPDEGPHIAVLVVEESDSSIVDVFGRGEHMEESGGRQPFELVDALVLGEQKIQKIILDPRKRFHTSIIPKSGT
ncbi:MAG: hypothetical protein JWN89_438 [Parcubacteria group bacterium]|nr:hypothetical protein [Parcubacteria group bacterium]